MRAKFPEVKLADIVFEYAKSSSKSRVRFTRPVINHCLHIQMSRMNKRSIISLSSKRAVPVIHNG